jgi:hypothetical protein
MTLAEVLLFRAFAVQKRTDKEAVHQRLLEIHGIATVCLENHLITQDEYEQIAQRAGVLF